MREENNELSWPSLPSIGIVSCAVGGERGLQMAMVGRSVLTDFQVRCFVPKKGLTQKTRSCYQTINHAGSLGPKPFDDLLGKDQLRYRALGLRGSCSSGILSRHGWHWLSVVATCPRRASRDPTLGVIERQKWSEAAP
jgi:hypothetical protein